MNNREYAKRLRLAYCWQKSKDHFANLSAAERAKRVETVTNEAQG